MLPVLLSLFGQTKTSNMKNILFLLAALLLAIPPAQAQLLDKLKKKAEDKIVQKAGEAMDGPKDKPAQTTPAQQNTPGGDDEVQVKRKFDFVPGNKMIFEENFNGMEEGAPPGDWVFSGTAEVATLNKIPGKWLMLNHDVDAAKNLGIPFPVNCTMEFDLFFSNLLSGYHINSASPDLVFTVGNDKNNKFYLEIKNLHQGRNISYGILGVNNTENGLFFSLDNYKYKPLPIRISINKQRLRVWLDETKIVDLQGVVGKKMMQSGMFSIFCTKPWGSRESYPFISNIRIADAGLTERDLSVAPAEPVKNKETKQSLPAQPKAVPVSLKDFGAYHALIIAVEDYADPNVNKLDNPVKDATQLQKTLTSLYTFDPKNVRLLINPNKKDVFTELNRLRAAVKETDNLLIFYAGHGYWDTDMEKGYWLPVDAERDLPTNWIANEDITGYIRAIKTKHTLLVSDACFSGGIFKTREAFASPRAVEEVYGMTSRKAIASGTLTVVPDKSVFIQYLIKKLEENKDKYLSEEQLFSQFKTAVINNSPGQVPQFGTILNTGDEGGNFIFIRK